MTPTLWSFIFLIISLMIICSKCFHSRALQFHHHTVLCKYFEAFTKTDRRHYPKLENSLVQKTFWNICDRPKLNSNIYSILGIVWSGETLPLERSLVFQKNQRDRRCDGNRINGQVCTSLESDEFPQLLRPPNEHISIIKRLVVPSMVHIQFFHSGYVHSVILPALSDWKELDKGSTVIAKNDRYMESGSSVCHILFGIGWYRLEQYKKQTFVVICALYDVIQFLWVWNDLLLFHPSTRLETMTFRNWDTSSLWRSHDLYQAWTGGSGAFVYRRRRRMSSIRSWV